MPIEKKRPVKKRKRRQKPVIGWREWVSLPELGVDAVKAKIDTGARSSSLHAFDIERFDRGGIKMVRFVIHPLQRRRLATPPVEAELVTEKLVRNPGGREEVRPVIRTTVVWNAIEFEADLNLTRRDEMGFRMLLGRQAVRRRFLVDPGRSFLGTHPNEENGE
ncbi:MAG: RimK/LysX family protein [Acidimicrobiia bacterium]|nr:RimK/LysX family protein [Acidimicrobiia bacterium]